MAILVFAEHDNRTLKSDTLKAVTAARAIASDIHVLVAGHDAEAVALQASAIEGVTRVIRSEHFCLQLPVAEDLSRIVLLLANDYSHILAAATTTAKSFMPRVAAALDVAQISEITEVVAADTFKRPIYAGNAIATVQSTDRIKVITVRSSAFNAASTGVTQADITRIPALSMPDLAQVVAQQQSVSERPDLTAASIVVSGGRALASAENYQQLIEPLADRLGAATGASRAAVDAGFAPNDLQVGQTGKIVAPDLYIAIGISGAIQHLAGMKDSKLIVAINKDEDAPIFQVADYGLVADLFQAVPQLLSELDTVGA
jgi:electron transfer flavoprotein alpha subunit